MPDIMLAAALPLGGDATVDTWLMALSVCAHVGLREHGRLSEWKHRLASIHVPTYLGRAYTRFAYVPP